MNELSIFRLPALLLTMRCIACLCRMEVESQLMIEEEGKVCVLASTIVSLASSRDSSLSLPLPSTSLLLHKHESLYLLVRALHEIIEPVSTWFTEIWGSHCPVGNELLLPFSQCQNVF